MTIVPFAQKELSPYNGFASTRIQETFSGVTILLDHYLVTRNRQSLELAVKAMESMLANYLLPTGEVRRYATHDGEAFADYTTVTCLIIPVVDICNVLRGENDPRYHFFQEAALRMARYLCERGLDFPTEGQKDDRIGTEMEDGSISCSALSLAYVCAYLGRDEQFLQTACAIADLHQAWSIYTPHASMYRSSLRWWETIWEGGAEGPALNCSHSWSIWRAEALFYLGVLTKNKGYLLDSYNGFMGCLSKLDRDGTNYAVYYADFLPSGTDSTASAQVPFRILKGKPQVPDDGLSNYVWNRLYDTWFTLCAVIILGEERHVLFGSMEEHTLRFEMPSCRRLFIDGYYGVLTIETPEPIELITTAAPVLRKGSNPFASGDAILITPDQGQITIELSPR